MKQNCKFWKYNEVMKHYQCSYDVNPYCFWLRQGNKPSFEHCHPFKLIYIKPLIYIQTFLKFNYESFSD